MLAFGIGGAHAGSAMFWPLVKTDFLTLVAGVHALRAWCSNCCPTLRAKIALLKVLHSEVASIVSFLRDGPHDN